MGLPCRLSFVFPICFPWNGLVQRAFHKWHEGFWWQQVRLLVVHQLEEGRAEHTGPALAAAQGKRPAGIPPAASKSARTLRYVFVTQAFVKALLSGMQCIGHFPDKQGHLWRDLMVSLPFLSQNQQFWALTKDYSGHFNSLFSSGVAKASALLGRLKHMCKDVGL